MPIPLPNSSDSTPSSGAVMRDVPFPASTRQAAGRIRGVATDVMVVQFADKILVTVTQDGALAQWIHVPLTPSLSNPFSDTSAASSFTTFSPTSSDSLLPLPHLTPTTLLGAGRSPLANTAAQLLATQIASAISTRQPDEARTVVLGLGVKDLGFGGSGGGLREGAREAFFDLVELVLGCL